MRLGGKQELVDHYEYKHVCGQGQGQGRYGRYDTERDIQYAVCLS